VPSAAVILQVDRPPVLVIVVLVMMHTARKADRADGQQQRKHA
jgi:hypothetical protein